MKKHQKNHQTPQSLDLLENKQILLALERTRLSNERTFLAWIRTGIACIGGGVAIIRFINFSNESHKFIAQTSGDILIVIGILFLLFSLINYRHLKAQLPVLPEYKETTPFFVTAAAIVLIIMATALLIII